MILSAAESETEGERSVHNHGNQKKQQIFKNPIHTHTHTHSILPEVQSVFGHMLESKLQFYAPENFWRTFKLWGQPVNVREQQDAYDFFCNLTDQVDERLKVWRDVE